MLNHLDNCVKLKQATNAMTFVHFRSLTVGNKGLLTNANIIDTSAFVKLHTNNSTFSKSILVFFLVQLKIVV